MAQYFKAILPEPFQILGLRLLPLSLGRYRILRRFDCAFVSEESVIPGPGDLILGIFICALTCRECLRLIETGEAEKEIEKWGHKIFRTGPWRKYLPKKLQRPKGFDYFQKVLLFKRYINDSAKTPTYLEEGLDSASYSGAHWSQSIEIVLRGELGWTAEEIDEKPISKAISDYYKWMENKGMIRLIDADEEKWMAETAAINDELLKQAVKN